MSIYMFEYILIYTQTVFCKKSILVYFFNGMKYDNSILLKSLCDIYKNEMTLNCIGNSCESFKMIDFKFKKMKYSFKLLDICNFIKDLYQSYLKIY